MKKKLDQHIIRGVKQLAQKECANYAGGSCLPEECPCHVIHPDHQSVHDGAVNCDYCLSAVLPQQPELNTAVWHELFRDEGRAGEGWKECVRCHKPFIPYAAIVNSIAPFAGWQSSRPGSGKSSAVTENGGKRACSVTL